MNIVQILGALLNGGGNALSTYGQYQIQKKRADQDDAFTQARIDIANREQEEREQDRLQDRADKQAAVAGNQLERAGIVGAQPALDAIAATNGNRTQGQNGTAGAIQDASNSALDALSGAAQAGKLNDHGVTDLGQGRYFVGSHLGEEEKPVMGSPEWLAAYEALIHARGEEARHTNAVRPHAASPTAAKAQDAMLTKDIDRYVAEAGGDSGAAMTRYFQNNKMGAAQSPEEAQKLSDLQTRFNASAQSYRNKTITGRTPTGTATEKGKIPFSSISKQVRQQWASEAGITPSNDPATVARFLDWVRANHPEVSVDLR